MTNLNKICSKLLVLALSLSLLACSSEPELTIDPELNQAVFTTPEQAAHAFYQAVADKDNDTMAKILGADFKDVLPVGELSDNDLAQFIQAWDSKQGFYISDDKTQFITLGKQAWTMPIPLSMTDNNVWVFDVKQGVGIMSLRRIGRNELRAIQSVLAYRNAQIDYATRDHDGDGVLEYAQQLISSPGKQDGLIWEGNPSTFAAKLSSLLSDRSHDGSFHGYQYKILRSEQQDDLIEDYIIDDSMSEGFALIAWPVSYDESGIMTFLLGKDGVLYERDLGENTAELAASLNSYHPTADWHLTDEESLMP